MVSAIPRRLLVHTVQYEAHIQDDYGQSYAPPVTINRVRLEPRSSLIRSTIREDVEATTVLFIDARHSTPFIVPVEKSRVTFGDQSYEVSRVNVFYADTGTIHHIEGELA